MDSTGQQILWPVVVPKHYTGIEGAHESKHLRCIYHSPFLSIHDRRGDTVFAVSAGHAIIAPYFDFAYMTQWAAGPAWRNMNAAQRGKMEGELAKSFLTILATNLSSYKNQQIRFFTPRGQGRSEKTVSAWIMEQGSYPTKLDFRFYRNKQGNWKIFDVKVAGNSAVSYYRNMFRQKLRHSQARARS
jgi:phospholipid transport system substrate-binding protein